MSDRPYVMLMVPPNLTGHLHIGHGLMLAVQDCLTRLRAQSGDAVVYVPGMDHAGIGMYVAALAEPDRSSPRRPVDERLTAWASRWRDAIREEIRQFDVLCAWERETYTLDPPYERVVRAAWRGLAERGFIFRDRRVVRWCPSCRTTISDVEVRSKPASVPVARFPIEVGAARLEVELAHPELVWGASAVVVPPELATVPRATTPLGDLPVVAGQAGEVALLVPAHDAADYALARRLGLPVEEVIGPDGRSVLPDAVGLTRDELRHWTFRRLRPRVEHRPGERDTCGRCDSPLIGRATWQWFLRMAPMVAPLREAMRGGEVRLLPAAQAALSMRWLDEIEDWCVSRQIPWGHRVPAWRCGACPGWSLDGPGPCPECGCPMVEERDVFDTWFSSSLWPLGTGGWPDGGELARLYPSAMLTTGRDILFFWLLRMLAVCHALTGAFPSSSCYLHGLVVDQRGQKMSKSRGNTMLLRDACGRYGSDVVRAGLLAACRGDGDVRAAPSTFARQERIRTLLDRLAALAGPGDGRSPDALTQWCFARLAGARRTFARQVDELDFAAAVRTMDAAVEEAAGRYLAIRTRERGPVHGAVVAELAALCEPVMPGAAAALRASAAAGVEAPAVDPGTVDAVQSVLDVVAELERLRGAVGINTLAPVAVDLPAGRWEALQEEPWLAAVSPLRLAFGGPLPGGVRWTLGDHRVQVALPASHAPRLAEEAARLARAEMAVNRRLRLRAREVESLRDGGARASDLAEALGRSAARLDAVRRNAAEARRWIGA
jgi:valyl-tRNA synthetase